MKKILQLNKGMFLATLVVGISSFAFDLVMVFYQASIISNNYYASVNGFNWMRYTFNAGAAIALIVLASLSLATSKDKDRSGREVIKLVDLFTAIEGGSGVLFYGFSLIEIASFNGNYVFNLILNMFFCVFGVIALLFIDKDGIVNKVLALISAFLIGAITLFNVFQHSFAIVTIDRLLTLSYIVLSIVSIFLMKESKDEPGLQSNDPNGEKITFEDLKK